MTQTQQPEALRLAEMLEKYALRPLREVAEELRRQHTRIEELEAQLSAIGAGGVEPLRKPAALAGVSAPAAQADARDAERRNGHWLTVVYRDIQPGDEARTIGEHPKVSALSWSHALHDRDAALATQAKQGGAT